MASQYEAFRLYPRETAEVTGEQDEILVDGWAKHLQIAAKERFQVEGVSLGISRQSLALELPGEGALLIDRELISWQRPAGKVIADGCRRLRGKADPDMDGPFRAVYTLTLPVGDSQATRRLILNAGNPVTLTGQITSFFVNEYRQPVITMRSSIDKEQLMAASEEAIRLLRLGRPFPPTLITEPAQVNARSEVWGQEAVQLVGPLVQVMDEVLGVTLNGPTGQYYLIARDRNVEEGQMRLDQVLIDTLFVDDQFVTTATLYLDDASFRVRIRLTEHDTERSARISYRIIDLQSSLSSSVVLGPGERYRLHRAMVEQLVTNNLAKTNRIH